MNGNQRETLVPLVSSPNGLLLDLSNDKIYWADASLDKVLYIDHHQIQHPLVSCVL